MAVFASGRIGALAFLIASSAPARLLSAGTYAYASNHSPQNLVAIQLEWTAMRQLWIEDE